MDVGDREYAEPWSFTRELFCGRMFCIYGALDRYPEPVDPTQLGLRMGTGFTCLDTVAAAIAIGVLSEDPIQGLCDAASYGGDTDTVAAMAGAILGARFGYQAWEAWDKAPDWVRDHDLADRLFTSIR